MTESKPEYRTLAAAEADLGSELERAFDTALHQFGRDLPEPERNYRFLAERKLEIDRAFVYYRVGCEIQGGVWTQGAHTRGVGYNRDVEKLNLAQLQGWILLWFTVNQLEDDPQAVVAMVRDALTLRGWRHYDD